MTKKYEVSIEAERFIHNDLSNCAWGMRENMRRKIEADETDFIYFDMMGSLIFSAFAIEAQLNFVGWKVLGDGWPERANIREKIDLLKEVLKMETSWGERPLQTVAKLKRLRDTLAHGKPEIVNETKIVDVKPSIWAALESQWESTVTPEFVDRCYEDTRTLWEELLSAANIEKHETLTHGGHSLESVVTD